MIGNPSAIWLTRGWVLLGRGAAGLLPIVLFSLASRLAGLTALGEFATMFMLAVSVGEIADFAAQRHVSRLLASGAVPDRLGRLAAFHSLRLLTLAVAVGAVWVAALAGFGSGDVLLDICLLPLAAWVFATNTYYASALALRRFAVIGLGPTVCLVVASATAFVLPRVSPLSGIWALVASVHIAKLCEMLLLGLRLPRPTPAVRRASLTREWKHTRFLFFQGLLSAANARLIVPFVAAIAGAQAAGILSLGLSLLAVTSLVSIAITVPAYRDVVERDLATSPALALRSAKREWRTALGAGLIVTIGLCLAARWLLAAVVGITDRDALTAVLLIVLGGAFESMNLFAGALYHASNQDRPLFTLSVATMSLNWIGAGVGVLLASFTGMGVGLLMARAGGALILYIPILAGLRPFVRVDPFAAAPVVADLDSES